MYFIVTILMLFISFILSKWKPEFRKFLIITTTLISIVYIIWRITVIPTNNLSNFIFGILLYIAEIIGLSQFFIFQFLFARKYKLKKKMLEDFHGNIPTVDVLICTYNESVDLLEKTILAAINLDYPKDKFKVHICDDGKRFEVKNLCNKYNINWITRNSNEGAKAGNINNALNQISGDLFAVLDADMIPSKEFLQKTVGYFSDGDVAFVQTPQVYYNQDMYQHNLKKSRPNEQDFFMRDVEEARASVNAVLHVGTNAVFKKEYVDNIGGYPTYSITEDMAVGMKLQAEGYTGIFINEALVLGLSASSYDDLVSQRDRWCRGNLQVFKHFNPITTKGLSISQKISYFDGVLYWFSSIQKMIYMIAPILYLLFGILIVNTSIKSLLSMFLPFFIGQVLIFKSLSNKTRSLIWSHFYEVAMAPHISLSILKELFGLKIKFNVTPKDNFNDKGYFQFKMALPHIVLAIFAIISLVIGFINLNNGSRQSSAYLINLCWTIYNLLGLAVAIFVAYQKPITENSEMVSLNKQSSCELFNIQTKETSYANVVALNDTSMNIRVKNLSSIKDNSKYILSLDNKINTTVTISQKYNDGIIIKYDELNEKETKYLMKLYIENIKPFYSINRNPNYIERIDIITEGKTAKKKLSA